MNDVSAIYFLQERCKDVEEMRWFDSLLFYGFEESNPIDKEDDDNKLLPAVVDKIVLPKLSCKFSLLIYVPLTLNLMNVLNGIFQNCPLLFLEVSMET